MVEHLPSMSDALALNPSIAQEITIKKNFPFHNFLVKFAHLHFKCQSGISMGIDLPNSLVH